MSDTKWADVAHYYTKSHIEVVSLRGSNPKTGQLMGMYQSDAVTVMFGKNQNVDKRKFSVVQLEWCKPILTHLRDMTEAEARELWEIQIGEAWVQDTDETAIQCLFFNIGNSQMEMADNATFLSVLVGEPKAWNYLISRGFDVFGLIESGQAIRKEMGNGNS